MQVNVKHHSKDSKTFTHYISEFRECDSSDFTDRNIKFVNDHDIRFCPRLEDLVDTWYISTPSTRETDHQTYSIEIVKCKEAKDGGAIGNECYDDTKVNKVLKYLVILFHETRSVFD